MAIAQTESQKVDPASLPEKQIVEVEQAGEQTHTQLEDVLPRLRDKDRPFNVVVFSDSTGAGRNTWTALTGEWLGEKYDRTVKGVQWDIHQEPNGYRGAEWNLSQGEGELVKWWNGASAAKDAVYSLKHLDEIAPIPRDSVDLVFVNHGHNHDRNELFREGYALINKAEVEFPNAAVVTVLQNPEDTRSPHRLVQRDSMDLMRASLERTNRPFIDAYTPFAEQDVDALMDETLIHPTDEGYAFWAGVVTEALDAADPE